jgi:hypothetical protein
MDPIQALNILSQVVKNAKFPFNDHVLLERCVDVLTKEIESTSGDESVASGDTQPVTFEEPELVEDVITEAPKPKARARARAKRK